MNLKTFTCEYTEHTCDNWEPSAAVNWSSTNDLLIVFIHTGFIPFLSYKEEMTAISENIVGQFHNIALWSLIQCTVSALGICLIHTLLIASVTSPTISPTQLRRRYSLVLYTEIPSQMVWYSGKNFLSLLIAYDDVTPVLIRYWLKNYVILHS